MKVDLNKYKAFFFDFDGVIVDSVNIKTLAFAKLYEPFGKNVVSKVIKHHRSHGGLSRFDKIRYYHRTYLKKDISERQVRILTNKFSQLVLEKVIKAPFIKGALKFLDSLRNKRLFLISATPENEIKTIAKRRGLSGYFADIKGSPLSKKDNLSHLKDKYGLNYYECVYFGDSQEDQKAAAYFKMTFIPINFFGKNTGYKDFSELRRKNGANLYKNKDIRRA